MGKYIRHGAAVVAGALLTLLLNAVPGIETVVTPEHQATLLEALTGLLTVIGLVVWGFGYVFVEKFLKRFRSLDPEGAADREAIKLEAIQRGYTGP